MNKITTEIIKNKNLTQKQKDTINSSRELKMDFDKDYEPETIWFFVKNNNKVVSLGGLRPITISYGGEKYNILGICHINSIERGKGYGTALIAAMIKHSKNTGKTLLGFTTQTEFFKKAGLSTKKDFIKRFIYKKPETGEEIIDNEGDGIYYNGKDNFVGKVLKTKDIVYINILHW